MPHPYKRPTRDEDERQSSPPQSTETLLKSLPASMRFVRGDSDNDEDDNDDDSANLKQIETEEGGEGDSPTHPQEGEQQSTPIDNENDSQSPNQSQNLIHTSIDDEPSTNLPMALETRHQWDKIADIYKLNGSHRADAL